MSTHYREFWSAARFVCRINGMELMALETEDERSNFDSLYTKSFHLLKTRFYHIGGILKAIGNYNTWHWISTKQPIEIEIEFNPGEPNNARSAQHCLALDKQTQRHFVFNDIDCSGEHAEFFICQKFTEYLD